MVKLQSPGVEPIAAVAGQTRLVGAGQPAGGIQRVPFEGMADRRQVNPNLMRSAREQVHFENRRPLAPLECPRDAVRRLAGLAGRVDVTQPRMLLRTDWNPDLVCLL